MSFRYFAGALCTLSLAVAAPLAAQQNLGKNGTSWHWDGSVGSGGWARIFNVNGVLHVIPSPDGNVHVQADKHVRSGGDASAVHYAVVRDGNNLTICALWSDDATC